MADCFTGEIIGYQTQSNDVTSANSESSVWTHWTASTSTAGCVWKIWSSEGTSMDDQESPTIIFNAPSAPTRTPEEIRRHRLEDARQIRRHRLNSARCRGQGKRLENQRIKAEDRAKDKAKKLLMELIGKADYKKFLQLGYLDVEGNSGKTYRIRARRHIEVRKGDIKIDSLCITTPNYYLPEHDEIAWKKLLAENNEKLLLEVANHHDE